MRISYRRVERTNWRAIQEDNFTFPVEAVTTPTDARLREMKRRVTSHLSTVTSTFGGPVDETEPHNAMRKI